MTTAHKGKSIKELVNSRITGTIYRREAYNPAQGNSKPSLQDIAESVLLGYEREEAVEQIFMNKSQKAEELNSAIIKNSVQNHSPVSNKLHTPTILQKLNPTKNLRKVAYVAVAEAQTLIAKEEVGITDMKKVQVKQNSITSGFGRVPKFLKSY